MLEDIRKHLIHYLILFLVFVIGFIFFWRFSYNLVMKQIVIVVMAAVYIAWGIIHHLFEENLNFKIVVEYVLIAILASTLILTMMRSVV